MSEPLGTGVEACRSPTLAPALTDDSGRRREARASLGADTLLAAQRVRRGGPARERSER
jgi:hypothetical protein